MPRIVFASVALLVSGMAAPALAQGAYYPFPYWGVYPNPYYEGQSGFGAQRPYCQKLCTQDFSPCDPPEFKRADGRCNSPAPGRL